MAGNGLEDDDEYTVEEMTQLETIWGQGFLSPGGPQEVRVSTPPGPALQPQPVCSSFRVWQLHTTDA
jgi:hypothetical protein